MITLGYTNRIHVVSTMYPSIHRLGQEHPVHITDIVASAKIDGRILDNLIHKRVICDDVKDEIKKKKNLKAWLDTPDEEFKFRKYQKPRKNDRS